jgi:hypothetical protein
LEADTRKPCTAKPRKDKIRSEKTGGFVFNMCAQLTSGNHTGQEYNDSVWSGNLLMILTGQEIYQILTVQEIYQ